MMGWVPRRWLDVNSLTGVLPTELGLLTACADMCGRRPRWHALPLLEIVVRLLSWGAMAWS